MCWNQWWRAWSQSFIYITLKTNWSWYKQKRSIISANEHLLKCKYVAQLSDLLKTNGEEFFSSVSNGCRLLVLVVLCCLPIVWFWLWALRYEVIFLWQRWSIFLDTVVLSASLRALCMFEGAKLNLQIISFRKCFHFHWDFFLHTVVGRGLLDPAALMVDI